MTDPADIPPTVYAVVRLRDGRYAVRIAKPGEAPITVKPFRTESVANEWIAVKHRRAERDG